MHRVEGTPFTILEVEDKVSIVAGKYLVKQDIKSVEEAERLIAEKDWDIIVALVAISQELTKNK